MNELQLTNAQKVVKMLDELADLCLEMDASNESADVRYVDSDGMNALLIFNCICGNMMIRTYQDLELSLDESLKVTTERAGRLATIFQEMTGVNPKKYYQKEA